MSSPANVKPDIELERIFIALVKSSDPKADGRTMPKAMVESWLTKVNPSIAQTDAASNFQKLGKPVITFSEFTDFITVLAQTKGIELKTLKEQLIKAPPPT